MYEQLNFAAMNIRLLIAVFFSALAASCNNQNEKIPAVPITGIEQAMKDSVSRFPDSLLLWENLIEYYRQNGDYEKALVTTGEALRKDSLNARLWDIKATLHFENEDTLQTIAAFENAVRILPAPEYLMSLGSLYAQTKNSNALAIAEALIKTNNGKTTKEGIFIKGLYHSYAGDKMKAIVFFDECLALDYNFMFGYREKAIALYDLGKYADALKVLDRAITLQNNFDEGYYWRGRCFEKLDKKAEAIEEYRMALMYSKDFIEAKEALVRLEVK